MNAFQWEVLQPVLHVHVVQASVESLVSQVDLAILHQYGLNGLVALVLLETVVKHLGVVREHTLCGISEDKQQLDVRVHLMDAFGDFAGCEIGWRLLHCQLVGIGVGHLAEIPRQALHKVTLPVKEVHLILSCCHRAVQAEHLNQRPRSPLPHANNYDLRKLLKGPIWVGGGPIVGGR